MENKKLIYANELMGQKPFCIYKSAAMSSYSDGYLACADKARETVALARAVDAVEVVRIDEVRQTILQTLDTLIATHRDLSNSQFSNYEKHLDIPKSSNDYYGIYADTMEIARRLVNAALTDLCSYGERREGE